jgi:small ligand-binding sensory domain FIST
MRRAAGDVYAALPILGSDRGDYLVRNLIGIDPSSGAIAVAEHVAEGMELMFCRRDAATAREDLKRMVAGLKSTLRSPPKAALYFSCLARGINLFGPDSAELGLIQAELGSIPLAGFFANGEISYNRLYTYTGVLTVFT